MNGTLPLVIRGGTVVTMDGESTVIPKGTVSIEGGRIVNVSRRGPRSAGPARVIDARGCAVVPGLIQSHVHLCQTLFRGTADDMPLLEWLRSRIWPLEGAHDARSMRASAELGLHELLTSGTTTILDMGSVHHQEQVFRAIERSGIRAISGKAMMDRGAGVPRSLRESADQSLRESERLRRRWHGKGDGRIEYAYAPRFILSCSKKLLRSVAKLSREHGILVHSHASEHRGERTEVRRIWGKDDVDALADLGISGEHVVLAHGVQLSSTQMRRLAKAGTRIVHCPSSNLKLASGIADVRAMLDRGVRVGVGADGAPCNNRLDAWTQLREAALLAKVRRDDASALSAEQVLRLATSEGAAVLGKSEELGTIEVGKRADVVVVKLDGMHNVGGGSVFGRLVYSTSAADVAYTIVDGRVVAEGGAVSALDADRVRREAQRELKRTLSRAEISL